MRERNKSKHNSIDAQAGYSRESSDPILSRPLETWDEVIAVIDAAGFPAEFMSARDQSRAEKREYDNEN
jgi:hypothetical protein